MYKRQYAGKMVLDGLVKAGIILDDSFGCIQLKLNGGYDKNHPRVEITVEDLAPFIANNKR